MASNSIREVVVNGTTYPIEADTSEIEAQLTAEDDLKFQFSKSGNDYGYLDDNGDFVPFKNPTGTKSITANGTYDVTDYASASVNVSKNISCSVFSYSTSPMGRAYTLNLSGHSSYIVNVSCYGGRTATVSGCGATLLAVGSVTKSAYGNLASYLCTSSGTISITQAQNNGDLKNYTIIGIDVT